MGCYQLQWGTLVMLIGLVTSAPAQAHRSTFCTSQTTPPKLSIKNMRGIALATLQAGDRGKITLPKGFALRRLTDNEVIIAGQAKVEAPGWSYYLRVERTFRLPAAGGTAGACAPSDLDHVNSVIARGHRDATRLVYFPGTDRIKHALRASFRPLASSAFTADGFTARLQVLEPAPAAGGARSGRGRLVTRDAGEIHYAPIPEGSPLTHTAPGGKTLTLNDKAYDRPPAFGGPGPSYPALKTDGIKTFAGYSPTLRMHQINKLLEIHGASQ